MTTNYHTPLTANDYGNIRILNTIFASLDAAISSGGVTGTAGEALSERDFVYLASDGSWYKLDSDATGGVAVGALRGCVTESGGISSAAQGAILLGGDVSGFSGLTAWTPVYAGTTAGGWTQTRPNVSDGGGQIAIIEMGYATSTTTVRIRPEKVIYANRETLADNATLEIEHHSDAETRNRRVRAYVATDATGATLAEYGSGNQDTDVYLEGPVLAGDSITITASAATTQLGDVSGTEREQGQSFTTVNGGILTQFTIDFSSNTGSPSGDVTWVLHSDDSNSPGTQISTGTFTPTPSARNTINLSAGEQALLSASTKYWLTFSVPAQATNNYYAIVTSFPSSVYAGGNQVNSTDGGSSWNPVTADMDMTITLSASSEYDELAQGFMVTGTQTVETVRLWLKKTGSPTGTLTVRIETDNSGDPSGTLADANLTVTVAESSLSTSYGWIDFVFSTPASISGSTQYHIVLSTDRAQSDTNYVSWGADASSPGYSDGEMAGEVSSAWGALSMDGIFGVFGEGTTYDEPLGVGSISGDSEEIGVQFSDDGGSNDDTFTTFKNLTGASADIVCEVIL